MAFNQSITRKPAYTDYESNFEAGNTWEFVNRFAGRKASDALGAWIAFHQTESNYRTTAGVWGNEWCEERPGDYQFLLRNVGLQWGKLAASNTLGYQRISDSVNETDCMSGEDGTKPCAVYGSLSKNDKRGAFVRYLNQSGVRDAIYLDLDDAYRQRFGNEFTFKVTYWDAPTTTGSSFKISYDSTNGTQHINIPNRTGAKAFKTYAVTVTDARLQNSLSATNDQNETIYYDLKIENTDSSVDYLHMLFVQGVPSAATPTPAPTATHTPQPNPTPDFREDMDSMLPGSFTAYFEENDADLSFVSTPDSAWRCIEGNQQQNWPNCWAYKVLSPAQNELTVDVALQMASTRQSMTGVYYFTSAGWGILTYFDMDGFLHVMCGTALCDAEFDYITPYVFETERWYTLRVYAHKEGGNGRIAVWVKPEGDKAFFEVYSNDELSFSAGFSAFRVFSLFGINNGQWYPETTYWNDAKAWWTQHPMADAQSASWVEPEQQLFAMSVQEQTYQHGVNGYTEGADTHIVTTNWESPTPHHTFSVLYLRTSSAENEVKSSLIRFEGLDIIAEDVISGTLSLYYSGQSVNGGSIQAHIAGMPRIWTPSQTTWLQYKTGGSWQTAGAKGIDDRWTESESRTIDYTEVGTWIDFDVTDIVRQGVNDFILYASSLGVNKDVQFPSNEYWDATKRPKLTISYVEMGVP